jgi:hypothetical protein
MPIMKIGMTATMKKATKNRYAIFSLIRNIASLNTDLALKPHAKAYGSPSLFVPRQGAGEGEKTGFSK